jgi:hypothetical protein
VLPAEQLTNLTPVLLSPEFLIFGGHSEEDPPVPIPNTEVKLFSADGTAWETVWESRSPPILYQKAHIKQKCLIWAFSFSHPAPAGQFLSSDFWLLTSGNGIVTSSCPLVSRQHQP